MVGSQSSTDCAPEPINVIELRVAESQILAASVDH